MLFCGRGAGVRVLMICTIPFRKDVPRPKPSSPTLLPTQKARREKGEIDLCNNAGLFAGSRGRSFHVTQEERQLDTAHKARYVGSRRKCVDTNVKTCWHSLVQTTLNFFEPKEECVLFFRLDHPQARELQAHHRDHYEQKPAHHVYHQQAQAQQNLLAFL
jgi:hypothetical protein